MGLIHLICRVGRESLTEEWDDTPITKETFDPRFQYRFDCALDEDADTGEGLEKAAENAFQFLMLHVVRVVPSKYMHRVLFIDRTMDMVKMSQNIMFEAHYIPSDERHAVVLSEANDTVRCWRPDQYTELWTGSRYRHRGPLSKQS